MKINIIEMTLSRIGGLGYEVEKVYICDRVRHREYKGTSLGVIYDIEEPYMDTPYTTYRFEGEVRFKNGESMRLKIAYGEPYWELYY